VPVEERVAEKHLDLERVAQVLRVCLHSGQSQLVRVQNRDGVYSLPTQPGQDKPGDGIVYLFAKEGGAAALEAARCSRQMSGFPKID